MAHAAKTAGRERGQSEPTSERDVAREARLSAIEAEGFADYQSAGRDARCEWPTFSTEYAFWRRGWMKAFSEERGL